MKKKRCFKDVFFVIYLIISLFFMETILRISTTGMLLSSGLLFSFIFSVSIAVIIYFIGTLFNGRISFIASVGLMILSAIIFSTQLVYYKFFRTFYSAFSAENANQIFEFWREIFSTILKNPIEVLLFFLPVIFAILFRTKLFSRKKTTLNFRISLLCFMIVSHLLGLSVLYATGREQYSPYDLYFKSSYPVLSVERLGLIATMRIDIKRLLFDWSPPLDTPPSDLLAAFPDKVEGSKTQGKKERLNITNIDFNKLTSNEKNSTVKDMHKYFSNVKPTSKNKYTGKYKGYNLILITAEAFSPYAVRKDITPTLYKMIHEGYNFTNFYNPIWGVSTTDGEYVACTGLIPKSGVWSFYKSANIYMPYTLGNQLKKLNYRTVAYHNHSHSYYRRDISHPNMGYDYKALNKGLNVKQTWPESDLEMMQKTVSNYIKDKPFHSYYMTVSGHMLYSFSGNYIASKNRGYVKNLPYSEACKAYLACQIELDRALEYLLKQLEAEGIADKTLIALSPDHYPYGLTENEIDELAGHYVERNFELYKSSLIMYTKGMKPTTVNKPCSSLDILPTLLNLLGVDYDSRLLMGQDIFSDSKPLVIFQNKSFITDKGRYNTKTRGFTANKGVTADINYINNISAIVNAKFYYSSKILETNYYEKVLTH